MTAILYVWSTTTQRWSIFTRYTSDLIDKGMADYLLWKKQGYQCHLVVITTDGRCVTFE